MATTNNFSATAASKQLYSRGTTWSNARGLADSVESDLTVQNWYSASTKWTLGRVFLYFNTSSLPDEMTITSARIDLYVDLIPRFDATAQIYVVRGTQADTLTTSDWTNWTTTSAGSYTFTTNEELGTTISITLNSTGINHINKFGTTKFVLIEDDDLNNNEDASNDVTFTFTNIKLYVTWQYNSPSVTTLTAGNITETSMTLSGNATSFGGASTAYGSFFYSSQGAAATQTDEQTLTSTGTFTKGISGLSPITRYKYKAKLRNVDASAYGSVLNSTTKPYEPSDLTAVMYEPSGVQLTWSSGQHALKTMIRYSANAIPLTRTDGEEAYFGSLETYRHSANRVQGTTYYYRAFSYFSSNAAQPPSYGEVWSTDYDDTSALFGAGTVYNVTQAMWYGDLLGALAGANAGDRFYLSGNHVQGYSSYTINDDAISISGQNMGATVSGLTLSGVSGVKLWNFTMRGPITLNDSSYCRIYNVSSASSTGYGIVLNDSHHNIVSGNKIYYSTNDGIYASGSATCYNYVYDNDIYSGSAWGVKIDSTVVSANIWKYNNIRYCSDGGIYV